MATCATVMAQTTACHGRYCIAMPLCGHVTAVTPLLCLKLVMNATPSESFCQNFWNLQKVLIPCGRPAILSRAGDLAQCDGQTHEEAFKKFNCNWVGNWLHPVSQKPRREKEITIMNKDEWVDSVELREVSDLVVSARAMRNLTQ